VRMGSSRRLPRADVPADLASAGVVRKIKRKQIKERGRAGKAKRKGQQGQPRLQKTRQGVAALKKTDRLIGGQGRGRQSLI